MNRYRLTKAGIDVNEGLHRFNENQDLYEKFLTGFPADPNYDLLVDAVDAKDIKKAFAAAHALKGVAGNLSLKTLFSYVAPFTEVLRAGSFEGSDEYMSQITEAYAKLIEALAPPPTIDA